MFNSLYIHIPFCLSKCDYCVFYSTANHTTLQRKDFLECLKKEFEKHKSQCSHLKSLFIGGGTPSCLSTRELQELFKIIHSSFDFADSAEFTIESNPASLNLEKIKVLADNGINRISLGVQSFNPDIRTILGRKGDITMLDDLFNEFHKNDIKNINLDMIYAIPEQTCHDW
ncbi:MAG: radical SAM protein, partial [Verrucomicrobiota bacterium]|nr:radical SAM protein [Verrucomicrobiota bacterium]